MIRINSNEDNIAYNLSEINYLKKNNSKSYLKNVYNILFYDSKKQISFKDEIFFHKIFDINTNINSFVEIKFKIDLEYRRINDRNYVKNIYEILDENDNSLYIKSASNDEYSYFSNRVIIDEEIFYTFTKNIKKIKFVIRFQKISSSSIIYLYYIKNNNYRLTIKEFMGCKKYFLYILYIMSDLENGYKINRYFYMDANQKILKYKKYCIISDCEKNASFNYQSEKNPIYCNTHKLKNMINVKKIEIDKYNCLLCNKYIPKDHYFSKEHIDNFKNNITINTRDSIKKIIC